MSPINLIHIFARHRNAANLLMLLMLLSGALALTRINTQFFPTFGIDIITTDIVWSGASAEDMEKNVITAVEPELRFIGSVKRVNSYATEGHASVVVEFEPGADMQKALSDVETAVGQVNTLPEDSEKPLIRRIVAYDPISRLVLSGPFSEKALKMIAKEIRDELIDRGIDKVDLVGARDEEIHVDVNPSILRELDLDLGDIAAAIRDTSRDLPSGTFGDGFEKQLRSLGLETDASGIGDIEILALEGGEKLHVRDIATVREGFDDDLVSGWRRGNPAIELYIQRSTNADALKLADEVDAYLAAKLPTLPPTLKVEQYDIQANFIRERIAVLLRNGASGLVLVLAVLFLFLNARLAFWVAWGIPTALMITVAVMLVSGQSINMISLFALIMTLGIIVDDAIVVGEHAVSRHAEGLSSAEAAEAGALRMFVPVVASSLTTVAAFAPILVISDIIGQIISAVPFVVIAVLASSVVECFLILPSHLRGAFVHGADANPSKLRQRFDARFDHFRDHSFRRLITHSVRRRYTTVAVAIALLFIAIGLLVGGRVGFAFFPTPESDTFFANVAFVPGTPRDIVEEQLKEIDRALYVAEEKLVGEDRGLVLMSFGAVGRTMARELTQRTGNNLAGMRVELVGADERETRNPDFVKAWKAEIRQFPGVEHLTLSERIGGPPGREIDIRLRGPDIVSLKSAALELRDLLERFPGVSDIEDDLPEGKPEIVLKVKPQGRAMGFTTQNVGRQVRDAFDGALARRFARGDEEVDVLVRFPNDGSSRAFSDLYLRAADGSEVPIGEVVSITESQGFARIRRENGHREVKITAEIDENITSSIAVVGVLGEQGLDEITRRWGLTYNFRGKQEEQDRTFGDMKIGAIGGLSAIYIILAWVFSSYIRPIVVMSIIPFGLFGAIIGHLVMGVDMSMLSMIALLGLSGILVNDSIILVSTIDERREGGESLEEAIINGSRDRLRAVILTSFTTIGGLLPLIFETSLQAQFLIPMAITMVFGLATATALVLVIVPSILAIQEDVSSRVVRVFYGLFPSRAPAGE